MAQQGTPSTPLAARLTQLVEQRGWTAADVSRATGGAVEHSTVYRMMTEPEREPRIGTVAAVARALGVSVDYLVGARDRPSVADPGATVDIPLLAAPPGPEHQPEPERWLSFPHEVLNGHRPHYALWAPPEPANAPGLAKGDLVLVSDVASATDGDLLVVRDQEGYAIRQYRTAGGMMLAATLAGDLRQITQAEIIGRVVGIYHWT